LNSMNYNSQFVRPEHLSLIDVCTGCRGKCCIGRTLATDVERTRIMQLAGADHFVPWKDNIYYLPDGPCPYLRGQRCSVQDVKPFVCQIFPFVPRVIDGEFWLLCVGECDAARTLPSEFVPRVQALARDFLLNWTPAQYEEYWLQNKQGDFDDTRVTLKIKVFSDGGS